MKVPILQHLNRYLLVTNTHSFFVPIKIPHHNSTLQTLPLILYLSTGMNNHSLCSCTLTSIQNLHPSRKILDLVTTRLIRRPSSPSCLYRNRRQRCSFTKSSQLKSQLNANQCCIESTHCQIHEIHDDLRNQARRPILTFTIVIRTCCSH